MTIIDENTSRADLELAAIFDCEFDLDTIEAASNEQLLSMIIDWIDQGNECA